MDEHQHLFPAMPKPYRDEFWPGATAIKCQHPDHPDCMVRLTLEGGPEGWHRIVLTDGEGVVL